MRAEDAAQIQYTSGTTGFPKGATLSHRNLTNNSRFVLARAGAKAGDVYLNVMPMFHTAGCSAGLLGSLQSGATMVLQRQFDAGGALRLIERERANILLAVPTMLIAMLESQVQARADLSSLKMVISGGAMVPPELVKSVQNAFGCALEIVYGQTEASPVLTQTRSYDSLEDQTQTVGQPLPHTEVAILGIDTGDPVPVGTVGEICARGYCNMLGYNDDEGATAKTIDKDGWLHTGDLGTMDARGFVRVTGRVKEMIIRGGENLFPAEIENALLEHPDIAEVAVVGVPDDKWGEIAICVFRAAPSCSPSRAELVAHVRARIAAFKTPAHFYSVESFPLTGSGKVQKFVRRERFVSGALARHRLE